MVATVSSLEPTDPRCPECGEPIGATATYCMHCSADLSTEELQPGGASHGHHSPPDRDGSPPGIDSGVLDPAGWVDDTLTVAVGIIAGFFVGITGTFVLLGITGSPWSLLVGVLGWLLVTAYLVRRRTVQAAVTMGAYAVAGTLLTVPLVAFGPTSGADPVGRLESFVVLLAIVAIPAGSAVLVGYGASQFVSESNTGGQSRARDP